MYAAAKPFRLVHNICVILSMPDEWKIEFYKDGEGRQPVREFIASLRSNPGLQSKIFRSISLLAEFGTTLSLPHSRAMTGHVFRELRVRHGSDIARVLYCAMPEKRMVLLHGFVKKTQKTSERDLAIGERRFRSMLSRDDR